MGRHDPKERVGVHKFGLFVAEHSNWVFREQPIVDVGVDAIIEQTIDRNPNGVMIACQIKNGNGNFYISKDEKLVYYVSHVHREYWINHDLPVILILIDDNGIIYWGLLNHNTIEKAELKFKTEIPKSQKLLPENINVILERVIHIKNPRDLVVDSGDTDSLLDEIMNMTIVNDSISSIVNAYWNKDKNLADIREKINSILKSGINKKNKQQLDNQFNRIATQNNILAERLKSEMKILASGFASHSHALRKHLINAKYTKSHEPTLNQLMAALRGFDNKISDYIEVAQPNIKTSGVVKSDDEKYRKAKEYLNSVVGLLIKEMEDMRLMIAEILQLMENKKNM